MLINRDTPVLDLVQPKPMRTVIRNIVARISAAHGRWYEMIWKVIAALRLHRALCCGLRESHLWWPHDPRGEYISRRRECQSRQMISQEAFLPLFLFLFTGVFTFPAPVLKLLNDPIPQRRTRILCRINKQN